MLCPSNAEAHLVTTGLGPIYDGIGHLALSPEVWVPVLAVARFAGLRGAAAGRLTLFLLPVAWLVGALVGCERKLFRLQLSLLFRFSFPARWWRQTCTSNVVRCDHRRRSWVL